MFLLLSSSENFRPSQHLHLVYDYLVTDLIVIRIRRNMLRPTLGPSAESFVQNPLNVTFIGKGSVTDICGVPCIIYCKINAFEPRELSVNEPLGLLLYTSYSREESIPAADVLVTADAVAGLAAAADDPTAALYLEPAAEAEEAPPPPPTSLWPCA